MTVEELLKPRFKVIATYPYNDHFMLNEIITLNEFDDRKHISKEMQEYFTVQLPLNPNSNALPTTIYESTLNLYPHIFKRLEWWEDRKEEDMIAVKYVRSKGNLYEDKVYEIDRLSASFGYMSGVRDAFVSVKPNSYGNHFFQLINFLPATKEEYENQNHN